MGVQKGKMDSHGDMGLLGEHFDPSIMERIKEDGYESRSGSDHLEGASGDDQETGENKRPRKKKYHRHTPHQIQELELYGFICLFRSRDLHLFFKTLIKAFCLGSFSFVRFCVNSCFKECPHPDEKQRMELSRRLGLENKQIKFWFQNRRTQMKVNW